MRSLPLALVATVFLTLATPAHADVSVRILNADKVKGTIDTVDERETFSIDCPAGAKFVVTAKGLKGFVPALRVVAPGETEPFADAVVEAKKAAKLKVSELPTSGTYVVEVTSRDASTGDYKLKVSWKTPKKTGAEIEATPEPTSIPFSAGAGTRVNLKAIAAKKSAALPQLVRLEGPDEFVLDLQDPAKVASDAAKKITLPRNGDYTLFVRDTGATGGGVKASIVLKQPKASRRNVDVRARRIGSSDGEQFAVSDIVGTGGGSIVIPLPGVGEDPISSIAGSGIVVPAGAVTTPTPIVVATAPDVQPKKNAVGAGPSVFFGPEGLNFKQDVSVTIPWDVDAFGDDTSSLVVYTRDSKGKVKLVPGPYVLDLEAGTCTFPVAHFSSFRVARDIGDAPSGNGQFAGLWAADAPGTDGEEVRVYLDIAESGATQIFETFAFSNVEECFTFQLLPAGFDLALAFRIENGMLIFEDPENEDALVFSRTTRSELPDPQECSDEFALPIVR